MSLDVDRTRGVKCAGLSGRASLRLPDHWGECAREVAEETEFTNEGTKGNEDDTEKTAGTQGRDRAERGRVARAATGTSGPSRISKPLVSVAALATRPRYARSRPRRRGFSVSSPFAPLLRL